VSKEEGVGEGGLHKGERERLFGTKYKQVWCEWRREIDLSRGKRMGGGGGFLT